MAQVKSLRTGIKFKDTPIGKIPVDWEATAIENVCDILDGKRAPLNKEQRDKMRGNIPYYGANGVVDHINDYIFDEDLILLAEDGGYFDEHQTRPIAYLIHGKSWVNNHAHVLKVREQAITEWIFYSLVHKNVMPFIKGGTRSKLNQGDLRQIPVPLPPFPEQKKIAEILTTVDDAIEETSRIIEKTKELKKGLMQKLLTYGIGHKKFKKTEIGKIPVDWEAKRLGDLCKGKPEYGANISAAEKDENLPRYVRITDVTEDGSLLNDSWQSIDRNAAEPYILREGDFLFARSGATVGKTYLYRKEDGDCAFAGYMIRFRPDSSKLLPEFLFQFAHSEIYYNWVKGMLRAGAQPNINGTEYAGLIIPKPPINEQNKIVNILSSMDEEIINEANHKQNLESLKKSLMQVLLTGRVRV